MKIKKVLREEQQKIDKRILADGQDLYNELSSQYCTPKPEQNKARKGSLIKWMTAVSCVVVICLVIGLSVTLTQPTSPQYLEQNEIRINSSMDEFVNDTKSNIAFGNDYTISKIIRIDDSVSSDKLYYAFEFEHKEELIYGELYVIVNKYYTYPDRHLGIIEKTSLNGYDVEYSVSESLIEDIPTNKYFGCILLPEIRIYFSIVELQLDDNISPLPILE
ncbi:MAG: hypothetical protein NC485_14835, partial [Ruminococcus flavefaciens]|nr:hypothetical protein [Ruminococcus flavefaciens]